MIVSELHLSKQNDQDFNFRKENLKKQFSDLLEQITNNEGLELSETTIKKLIIHFKTIVFECLRLIQNNVVSTVA